MLHIVFTSIGAVRASFIADVAAAAGRAVAAPSLFRAFFAGSSSSPGAALRPRSALPLDSTNVEVVARPLIVHYLMDSNGTI